MSNARSSKVSEVTVSNRRRRSALVLFAWLLSICAGVVLLYGACTSAPQFGDVPKIDFVSLSKDTMQQGLNQEDSIIVTFHFEDGDGDIGRMTDSEENNVFFVDTRTGQLDNSFGIPFVPPQGSTNGIEGDVHIKVYSTCCIFPLGDPCESSTQFPENTLTYEIYIMDRAGNMSNVITTPVITLLCN